LLLLSRIPIFFYLAGTGIRARSTHLFLPSGVTLRTSTPGIGPVLPQLPKEQLGLG